MQNTRLMKSKVHFIGIGGIGMSGLAELLHNMGADVSGSDMSVNSQTKHLTKLGVKVFKGHEEGQVTDCDVVVYTSAIKPTNVEYKQAQQLGIPLIPRAEALAEIMLLKKGVAIAGTHGKTTTTSLMASVFINAKADPTIVVGGRLDLIKSTALLGEGQWLIAEADESDGSFSRLSPEVVVITNIDSDHLDHYKTFENVKRAFYDFASRIPFYGQLIYCGDDRTAYELFKAFPKNKFSYGFGQFNDYVLDGEKGVYKVLFKGELLGQVNIPIPGKHNALNSLAAIVCGLQAGFSFKDCADGVAGFGGVDRRFQHKAEVGGVDYYDDYAHHPTELKAVFSAFAERYPERPLKVIFQPHRFKRTQDCWSEFSQCFNTVSELFLLDIYPAGEAPIEGVTSELLAKEIPIEKKSVVSQTIDGINQIKSSIQPGDVVVLLGAGNISKWGEALYS